PNRLNPSHVHQRVHVIRTPLLATTWHQRGWFFRGQRAQRWQRYEGRGVVSFKSSLHSTTKQEWFHLGMLARHCQRFIVTDKRKPCRFSSPRRRYIVNKCSPR